ncbi:MAG: hypothetical protein HY908_05010 [Myxococcales bacterium]|nr:hypothetical protein [Myxococcales bacterium]
MKASDTGCPRCGHNGLGTREVDLKADEEGKVQPGRGGMSVSPDSMENLPHAFRPLELGGLGRRPVFRIDSGDLPPVLWYRPDPIDPCRHGFVEPATSMANQAYQAALCDTAPKWTKAL